MARVPLSWVLAMGRGPWSHWGDTRHRGGRRCVPGSHAKEGVGGELCAGLKIDIC